MSQTQTAKSRLNPSDSSGFFDIFDMHTIPELMPAVDPAMLDGLDEGDNSDEYEYEYHDTDTEVREINFGRRKIFN